MTETCAHCGKPTDRCETHHVNHRKGDNYPDNLSPRDRRCHMRHHENDRATDNQTMQEYGPDGPSISPKPRP